MEVRRIQGLMWSNIIAGFIVSLGTFVFLTTIGLGTGFSSIDFTADHLARSAGMFTGAWGFGITLVALTVGGLVAGISAQSRRRGAVQGFTLWGLAVMLVAWGAASAVVAGVQGGAKITTSAFGTASDMVGESFGGLASAGGSMSGLADTLRSEVEDELSFDDVLAKVNEKRGKGKEAITKEQLKEAGRAMGRRVMLDRKLDRADVEHILVAKTGISAEEARELSETVTQKVENAKSVLKETRDNAQRKAEEAKQDVKQAAIDAGEKSAASLAKVSFSIAGLLGVALIAAVGGGAAGATLDKRAAKVSGRNDEDVTNARVVMT